MKWIPSNIGAEPKKLVILGALLAAAGTVYWINSTPDAPAPNSTAKATPIPTIPTIPAVPQRTAASSSPRVETRAAGRIIADFRPSLKLPEGTDVSLIDPALHLELLAKLRSVEASGGSRSLFAFSDPPPPPPPKVKPIVPGPVAALEPPKPPTEVAPLAEPAKPPPLPIPLKFYGYAGTSRGGARRAFFLDGEDIFVAAENELIRNRYKIVRIGVNSAVVEDTTNQNQQTLPLAEEAGAA